MTGWVLVGLRRWVVLLIILNEAKGAELTKGLTRSNFRGCMIRLFAVLFLRFRTLRAIKFYMWFELSLLPTFLLVIG